MALALVATGPMPMPPTSPREADVKVAGTALKAASTRMRTATLVPEVAVLLVAAVTDSGEMENTSPGLPTPVSSASYSVSPMTQLSSKPVSTSRNTTIFQSRPLDTMFRSLSSSSPTRPLTSIYCETSNSLTTRSQLLSRSTLFPSLWAAVI